MFHWIVYKLLNL